MRLVATMASSWGIEAETKGKEVWFEVSCEGSHDAAAWYADVDVDALLTAFDDGDALARRSQPSTVTG